MTIDLVVWYIKEPFEVERFLERESHSPTVPDTEASFCLQYCAWSMTASVGYVI